MTRLVAHHEEIIALRLLGGSDSVAFESSAQLMSAEKDRTSLMVRSSTAAGAACAQSQVVIWFESARLGDAPPLSTSSRNTPDHFSCAEIMSADCEVVSGGGSKSETG